MQSCSNCIANALELLQSCTKPPKKYFTWPLWIVCVHQMGSYLISILASQDSSSREQVDFKRWDLPYYVIRPLWYAQDVLCWSNPWWRHQMEIFSALLAMRAIHRSPVNSPHKGQWREALIFSLDLRLNKRLSKQPRGWRFEMPLRPLSRHCNAYRSGMMHHIDDRNIC